MTERCTTPGCDEELPGMLSIAEGIAAQRWPHTMDAQRWAEEFVKLNPGADHDLMLSWFANAIMAGYDTAQARATSSESTVTGQLAQKLLEIDAARYRYLRKYGWDLITLPPSTAHNEENATGPANLDELVDRSIARIAEGSSR